MIAGPKTIKVIGEILENFLCVGKRKETITKKKVETKGGARAARLACP